MSVSVVFSHPRTSICAEARYRNRGALRDDWRNAGRLDHFLFYCRPSRASLNQALAFAGVMDGRASVMA
jgi:hypothetical protein